MFDACKRRASHNFCLLASRLFPGVECKFVSPAVFTLSLLRAIGRLGGLVNRVRFIKRIRQYKPAKTTNKIIIFSTDIASLLPRPVTLNNERHSKQVSRSSSNPFAISVIETYKSLLIPVWNSAIFRYADGRIAPLPTKYST